MASLATPPPALHRNLTRNKRSRIIGSTPQPGHVREGPGGTALTGQPESQVQKAVTVSNGDRQVGPGPEPATRRLKVPSRKC